MTVPQEMHAIPIQIMVNAPCFGTIANGFVVIMMMLP